MTRNGAIAALLLIVYAIVALFVRGDPNVIQGVPDHETCRLISAIAFKDATLAYKRYQDAFRDPAEFRRLADEHKEYHSLDMLWREAFLVTQEGGDEHAFDSLANRFGTRDSSQWKLRVPISMNTKRK